MARAIIKLMEVAIVLLNSTDWINTHNAVYNFVGDQINGIIEILRNVRD